jgi:YegS/Rv2252/BmrU family lipid kinase
LSRSFALLVNPASAGGKALKALPVVHEALDRLGAEHRTVTTRSSEHAAEEATRAAAVGETVAALSGDGMLRPLAGALKGTPAALAVIPCGRGNDLARVLGIPTDTAEAVQVAVEGPERLIDVAEVDGTPYVGIASFGFDSEANRIANDAKLVRGNAVYLYAALRALAAWKPAAFTVTVDGERHEFSGYSIAVGNSKAYGGGMYVVPDAELDDGLLDGGFLTAQLSKFGFATKLLPRLFKGTHVELEEVTVLRGKRWEVSADRPFTVYADGDPIADVPVVIDVDPGSLRVVVPSQPS